MASSSPYIPQSDSVGVLGQPDSNRDQAPDIRESQAPVHTGKETRGGEPNEFELEGKDTSLYTESMHPESTGSDTLGSKLGMQKHEHPLMATHDTNIPHGHDPLAPSEYDVDAAAPPAAGAPHQKKGVGEKLKGAAKGFKDAMTGHKEKHQTPHDETSPGFADKVNNAVTGQYPAQGTATGNATAGGEEDYRLTHGKDPKYVEGDGVQGISGPAAEQGLKHETGWPKPVPPPSMYNPTAPHHYSPKTDPSPVVDSTPQYARDEQRKEAAATPGSYVDPSTQQHATGYNPSSASLSSTPAEPNTKHDVPRVDNTAGRYTDPTGNVHHEGPRDDNVKKEGLMSKMMDKLHLGSHDKRKDTASA